MDTCNICDNNIVDIEDGITILGENIKVIWAGRLKSDLDIFEKNGSYAPFIGRLSITICKPCLKQYLKF